MGRKLKNSEIVLKSMIKCKANLSPSFQNFASKEKYDILSSELFNEKNVLIGF